MHHGLYLENIDILVPWKTSFDIICNFGNPEIRVQSEQRKDAIWKNAKVFDGLELDLTSMFWRTFLGYNRFDNVHGYIDLEKFEKFKPHLDHYFNQEALLIKRNQFEYYFKWSLDKCEIKLGQGNRFGEYFYLDIKRKGWF